MEKTFVGAFGRKAFFKEARMQSPPFRAEAKDDGYVVFPPISNICLPTGTHWPPSTGHPKDSTVAVKGLPDISRPVVSQDATHTALIQDGAVIWVETFTGKELWRHTAPTPLSSMFLMDSRRLFIGGERGWQVINVSNGAVAVSIAIDEKLALTSVTSIGGDRLLVANTTGEHPNIVHHLATWDCKSTRPSRRFDLNSGEWGRIDGLVGNIDCSWVGAVVNHETLLLWPSGAF